MTLIVTQDTIWSGDITLKDNVQIAPGVTLTLEGGTTLRGAGYTIEVGGGFHASGVSSALINFENVDINYLPGQPSSKASIEIEFTHWNGGKFLDPTGNAVYGSFSLLDSVFQNVNSGTYSYIWYPTSQVSVERNIFSNSGFFSVGTNGVDIKFANNVFANQSGIQVWANYGSADVSVVGNSFVGVGYALAVQYGYTSASFGNITENYFEGLTDAQIEALIIDRSDDLNYHSYINIGTVSETISPSTPKLAPIDIFIDSLWISENSGQTSVGQISAIDLDSNLKPTFSIVDDASGFFKIADGKLSLSEVAHIDYEMAHSYELTIRATDGSGLSLDKKFTIGVIDQNDKPVANFAFDSQNATEGLQFHFTISAEIFTDVDAGDHLLFAAQLANDEPLPSWLTFDTATRTFSGTPSNEDVGTLSIYVTATDTSGAFVSDTFELTIGNVNDAPKAVSDFILLEENSVIDVAVLANDVDEDGDVLSVTEANVTSENAGVTINSDGTLGISYTGSDLAVGETATVAVTYTASDGMDTDSATLTITVNGRYEEGDDVVGDGRANTLRGSYVGESIFGLGGKDKLFGNAGNDHLYGGKGTNKLTGGSGADTFHFSSRDGNDIILDFSAKRGDIIDLADVNEISNWRDLLKNHMSDKGDDLLIFISNNNWIRVEDVNRSDIGKADFDF